MNVSVYFKTAGTLRHVEVAMPGPNSVLNARTYVEENLPEIGVGTHADGAILALVPKRADVRLMEKKQ